MIHDIIPPSLAIKAMRDSGYRDTAHALAELVDNSVQAEAKNIEIICLDRIELAYQRSMRRVDRIAVFDDGEGMDKEGLQIALQFGNGKHLKLADQTGIGKFGMGLPNSSISQCQRVDVWSWQGGTTYYTYLDTDEIQKGILKTVPEPKQKALPSEITQHFRGKIKKSGTLVVWSRLDRLRWKSSKALLDNSEFLIGRMYRYFLDNKDVRIRLAAFSPLPSGEWQNDHDDYVRPNDPLYLMKNTACPDLPEPFIGETMFEEYGPPDEIEVGSPGTKDLHTISIRYSIVRTAVRKKLSQLYNLAGSSPPGKNAANNIGISIVRAGRELELSHAHVIGYDPVERWWGVEVSFPPALDEIFGVTNNKQSATAFMEMNLDQDAEAEDLKPNEFKKQLEEAQDPRWVMYEVSRRIHANLKGIRKQLGRMTEGTKTRPIEEQDTAEVAATKATQFRKDEGYVGTSDKGEEGTANERAEDLSRKLEELGADPAEARDIAASHVQAGIKYIFQQASYEGASFFAVSSRGGTIIVTVNKEHPVTKYLIGLLEDSETDKDNQALVALKLLFCAWARLEDETQNDKRRQGYVDTRDEWGRMTRDFLNVAYGD